MCIFVNAQFININAIIIVCILRCYLISVVIIFSYDFDIFLSSNACNFLRCRHVCRL